MKILIAVTGGISAYKAADIISALISTGHEVRVITTDNALNFVTPHVLNVISRGNYVTETPSETKHIELAKWCDAFVVVPATANTIAKLVNGFADNLVTATFLALPEDKKRIIFPAMNTNMFFSEATLLNLKKLEELGPGCTIVNPVEGLLACGDYGMGKLPSTRSAVESIIEVVENTPKWYFPLMNMKKLEGTDDSFSFLDIDLENEVQIPVGPHVGAFGIRRRHDVHKGIDLYAPVGEKVYPVESGTIVDICPFTGEIAGFPWWENTWGVYVEGKSGVVVYGEIQPNPTLKIGDIVNPNRMDIGSVLQVLKRDNKRPLSMLHLELHDRWHIHTEQWEIGKPKPEGILDPTKYLLKSIEI